MYSLIFISILIVLGFNESYQEFRREIRPDPSANEFHVPIPAHGKQTRSVPQNDLSKVSNRWAKLWMAKDLNPVVELYGC